MEQTKISVEAIEITGVAALDPIQVYWRNLELGQGHVTIVCWDCAWSAYFGAMGHRTIQQFFAEVDIDYLVVKLGVTQLLRPSKKQTKWLRRIIDAIKEALAEKEDQYNPEPQNWTWTGSLDGITPEAYWKLSDQARAEVARKIDKMWKMEETDPEAARAFASSTEK